MQDLACGLPESVFHAPASSPLKPPDRYTGTNSTSGSSPSVAENRTFRPLYLCLSHGQGRAAYGSSLRERSFYELPWIGFRRVRLDSPRGIIPVHKGCLTVRV